MQKTIVVLYWGSKIKKLVFSDKKYKESYETITKMAESKKLRILFSNLAHWDGNKFKKAIFYNGKKWGHKKNILPDLIFDKTQTTFSNIGRKRDLEKYISIVNPVIFDLLCNNKFINYLLFEKFYPKSFLISNSHELNNYLDRIKTKMIVVKPTVGTCGNKVQIVKKKDVRKIMVDGDHFLLQEFIDSSGGIKSLIESIHDLRVVIVNNRIIYAYIRTPRGGKLLCNIAQGGKMRNIRNSEIPKGVKLICKEIMKKFRVFSNLIYAVDFAIDKNNRAKIIEMNSSPGVYFYPRDEKDQQNFYNALLDNFSDHINNKSSSK